VAAQRRWGYVCVAIGAALTVFTLGAIVGASTYEITAKDISTFEQIEVHGAKPLHEGDVNRVGKFDVNDPMEGAPSRQLEPAIGVPQSDSAAELHNPAAPESTRIESH